MRRSLAILALLLAACATDARPYPDCWPMATGGEVCAVPDAEEQGAQRAALAWFEVASIEWSAREASDVLSNTRIVMGPLHNMSHQPCLPEVAGCFVRTVLPNEVWVNTRNKHGEIVEPCASALAHELTHAAEYQIDGYDIDDKHEHARWSYLEADALDRCEAAQ